MKLTSYKSADPNEVASKIVEKLTKEGYKNLDWKVREIIEEILQYDYTVMKWTPITKPKPLWRLTIPFFLISWLLLIIFIPIKWMFTGTSYYDPKKFILRTHMKWARLMKIFSY